MYRGFGLLPWLSQAFAGCQASLVAAAQVILRPEVSHGRSASAPEEARIMNIQQRLFENEFPNRPKDIGGSVIRRTAELLLSDIQKWANNKSDSILANIIEALGFGGLDGYELARNLERRGWFPDAELVEILDNAISRQHQAHREEVEAWVRAHDLRIDLRHGAKVEITVRGSVHIGEIVDLHPKTMQYTVFVGALGHVRSGTGTHGLILGFEEVRNLG